MPVENTSSANILAPGLAAALLLFLATWANVLHELPADYVRAELIGYASMLLVLVTAQWLSLHKLLGSEAGTAPFAPDFLRRVLHGCLLAAVAAGGLGLAMWIYYAEVDPAYLPDFLAMYENTLLSGDLAADELERRRDFLEASRDFLLSPFKQAMLQAGTALAVGIFASPFASFLAGITAGRKRKQ